MSLMDAMRAACGEIGIREPARIEYGRWLRTDTLERNGKQDATVKLDPDGAGGVAWNHQTGEYRRFRANEDGTPTRTPRDVAQLRAREARREAERQEAARIASAVLRMCQIEPHGYLARKGFPDERRPVWDRTGLPQTPVGRAIAAALPEGDEPLLVVPGRRGRDLTTLQFITESGVKKNLLHGVMSGASCRLSTGRETWVAEGIATALTVLAALRLLGRPATVLAAFAAANVAKVAEMVPGAIIAADHDKPVEALGGMGAGEFYARRSGRTWVQPPEVGDFNDWHQSEGLRTVALLLREVRL